jgi:hypothetical protein
MIVQDTTNENILRCTECEVVFSLSPKEINDYEVLRNLATAHNDIHQALKQEANKIPTTQVTKHFIADKNNNNMGYAYYEVSIKGLERSYLDRSIYFCGALPRCLYTVGNLNITKNQLDNIFISHYNLIGHPRINSPEDQESQANPKPRAYVSLESLGL